MSKKIYCDCCKEEIPDDKSYYHVVFVVRTTHTMGADTSTKDICSNCHKTRAITDDMVERAKKAIGANIAGRFEFHGDGVEQLHEAAKAALIAALGESDE